MTSNNSIPPQTDEIKTPLAAALDYAARGWAVLPLHTPLFDAAGKCTGCSCEAYARSDANRKRLEAKGRGGEYSPNYICSQPGKHPNGYLAPHWVDDATTDPKTIRSWWKRAPLSNVGIACGASGLLALDADFYKENFSGDLSALDQETVTSLTGGGGTHLIYAMPEGATYGNGTGDLEAGIDIRGHGGQIVAPPSLHPSGNRYQWEAGYGPGEIEPAPLPAALRARLDATARKVSKETGPPDSEAVARSVDLVKRVLKTGEMAHGNPVEYGNGGRRVNLTKCPFNPEDDPHGEDGSAIVIIRADGEIVATCNHNRCKQRISTEAGGRGWEMLKTIAGIAPGATASQNGASEPPPVQWDDSFTTEPPAGAITPTPAGKVKGKPKAEKAKRTGQAAELQTKLQGMGYTFRLNEVSEQLEANGKPLHSGERADILTRLYDVGITNRTMSDDVIEAIAWRNRYHPVRDYLNGLQWDGVARIVNFGKHLRTDDAPIVYSETGARLPVPAVWLYRWMIGAVARVLDEALRRPDVPVFVLSGPQKIGKSTFAHWLAGSVESYFREGSINPESTEHQRALCETWIWEVGEFGHTTRRADVEALKHFLTQDAATYRIPYAKHPVRKKSLACFIGTINPDGAGFLSDTTGNRRFLVANVKSIDWGYRDLPVDQLWAEAVHIWRATPDAWQLQPEEVERRDVGNVEHMQSDWVTDAIQQLFTITPRDAGGPVMTVHDIVRVLQEHGGKGYAPKALQMQTAAALGALEVVRMANVRPRAYAGIAPKVGVYVPDGGAGAA